MSFFRNHTVLEVAKTVKVFLHLEAGVTRGDATPQPGPRPATVVRAAEVTGGDNAGVRSEDIVWIFGTARTGSTWLTSMMGEMAGDRSWKEPLVGQLFGGFYGNVLRPHLGRPHFILSDSTRETWLEGVRYFVLNALRAHFPGGSGHVVIGEPNGSSGAPLMMEALPESRMILLVRDPRDVAASAIDRHRKGSGAYEMRARDPSKAKQLANNPADRDPDGFIKTQARRYAGNMGSARQAYNAHRGRKALVRYEDLRYDTLAVMRRVYHELKLPVDEGELASIVKKHDWNSIPADQKGPGKDNRKATPGGWREDLTPRQAKSVERLTTSFLDEFYPGWHAAGQTENRDISMTGDHH